MASGAGIDDAPGSVLGLEDLDTDHQTELTVRRPDGSRLRIALSMSHVGMANVRRTIVLSRNITPELELRERMAQGGAPAGFEDVVATLNSIAEDQPHVPAHWSVTFAVEDADATAEWAAELGGEVLVAPCDAPWVRMAVIADPQGEITLRRLERAQRLLEELSFNAVLDHAFTNDVFFETDPETLPPSAVIASVAPSRLKPVHAV